ncbi:iron-containing alcohol dehydrogenase [bacterium LRH843]|nr:iron-containing alcohol dehydrogenase [bacterium LRH843]
MISNFLSPTKLYIGLNSIEKISEIIEEQNARKVYVVTDKGLQAAGVTIPLLAQLEQTGAEYIVFDGVEPDPTEMIIHNAFEKLQSFEADLIIGIGGGSSIDTAKAIGILATNGGEISDYRGVEKVTKPILPLVAIPTTAGTGSEVTTVTVLIDAVQKLKYSIGGKNVAAKWAIIDANLTLSVPPRVTAFTGIDALTHAIEAYTSKLAYPITDALAKEAITLIAESLRTAVYQGTNIEARENMLMGSLLAGLAFSNAKLGLCHVLCNPLGAHYNIPHGLANAILLPYVTAYNVPSQLEKYAEIASILGESVEGLTIREAAERATLAIQRLNQDVNIPVTLADVGVEESNLERMVEECYTNPLVQINPRTASKDDLHQIYKNALNGGE